MNKLTESHQKMLCEEVLRRCNNIPSEWAYVDDLVWKDVDKHIVIKDNVVYRAKQQKALIIPWGWVNKHIKEITITVEGNIIWGVGYTLMMSLDLTGVELPITIKRP